MAEGEKAKGYNLGVGFVHATVSFDGIGRDIAKEMRKVTPKAGVEAGKRIGKGMREGVESEAAKVDLKSYEAHVTAVEKRVAKQVAESTEKQESAKRKVSIAEAKLAEAREKYKEGSSQVLAAEDKLSEARGRAAREAYAAEQAQAKLNEELSDAKKSLGDAKKAAEETADAYKKSFGRKFVRRIHESLREAVTSQTAVAAAAAGGAMAGAAWGSGFKRALGTENIGKSMLTAVSGMSGLRVLGDIGGGFRDFIGNLDRSVPKIGLVATGLMTLGGAAIAGVGGILGVTNALGSIAAVALTLPGMIGAGAAAFGVFSLAMLDAMTVLEDLGPALINLQDRVSSRFWEEAAQPIRNLANNLLPLLTQKMGESATAMGSFFGAAADEFNTGATLDILRQMFDYLTESIWVAHDAVAPLTSAVMNLGNVGASYLPNLAGWFVDISNRLNDFILASIASGDIFRWIDTGLENLRALGEVIWNTVGIFHALGTAASDAGAGGLVGLATGLERVNEALHADEWQAGLRSMFSGASEAMSRVGDGFGNFARGLLDAGGVLREGMILSGDAIGSLLSLLGGLFSSPAVQGGLATFFAGTATAAASLESAAAPLGAVLGGLLDVMGTMAATLGPVVARVIAAVAPAITSLMDGIRPLIPVLGEIVASIIEGLAPVLTTVANIVQNVVLPPLVSMFEWIADNSEVLSGIATVLGTVAAVLGAAAGAVALFRGALAVLRGVMIGVNIVMGMNPFVLVAAAIAGLVAAVVLAYNRIGWFKDFVDAAWAGIKAAFSATIDWITTVAWPALLNGLQWVGDKFVWLYENVVQPVWGWIKGAVSAVIGWFTNTAAPAIGGVLDRIGNTFDFLYRNFIAPFVWLFKQAMSAAWTFLSDTIFPGIRGALDAIGGAFTWLNDHVIQPVWTWIQDKIAAFLGWFVRTKQRLEFELIQLGQKFRLFYHEHVKPVWDWVQGKIDAVVAWFRDVLVPAFRRAIQWVMDKFSDLWSRVRWVWDSVRDKLRDGWNWVSRNVLDPFRSGLTRLQDAFTSVKDGISRAWDQLKAKVKEPISFVVRHVINPFLNGYNTINDAWSGTNIDPIRGFSSGGYTGKGGKYEPAGVVHKGEYVLPQAVTEDLRRTNPGFLESLHHKGASALPSFGHEGHAAGRGEGAAAGRGGPGSYLWGPLQNRIYSSGVAHVAGSAPGFNLAAAARAWNNIGNLRVKYGRGQNQINVGAGAPAGTWGYAWTNGQIQLNPNIPAGMKTGTAAHEIGHVLGLDHAGTNSIMHPMMRGPLWPSAFDRASIQRIYGGSGKGNPPEGGGLIDWITEKLSPLTKIVGGVLKTFKGGMGGNVFSGMAGGIAEKVTKSLMDHAKAFLSGGMQAEDINGMLPKGGKMFAGSQKWDDPVGTVHKLSPGVSSIYNGTGGDEYFTRTAPGGAGNTYNIQALDLDEALRKLRREEMKREALYAV